MGRLFGDRLVARFGRARVVQGSGAVAAAGSALAVAAPSSAPSLVGWALFGIGLAALAPTVLGAAPDAGDLPPAVAIAAVTSIGYLGSFTGPPAIGALAEFTELSAALGLLVGRQRADGPPGPARAREAARPISVNSSWSRSAARRHRAAPH